MNLNNAADAYYNQLNTLDIKYEKLEAKLYADFLEKHKPELTPEQYHELEESNALHIDMVLSLDRLQERVVKAWLSKGKPEDAMDKVAEILARIGDYLVARDQMLYKHCESVLQGNEALMKLYADEVTTWASIGSGDYVKELEGINRDSGLDELNKRTAEHGNKLGDEKHGEHALSERLTRIDSAVNEIIGDILSPKQGVGGRTDTSNRSKSV